MQNLTSLKHLNLYEITDGVLSELYCLQDMTVGDTLIRGIEVCGLKKLEILLGKFDKLSDLNMYVQALDGRTLEELREYIFVGEGMWSVETSTRKRIDIGGCNIYTDEIMVPHMMLRNWLFLIVVKTIHFSPGLSSNSHWVPFANDLDAIIPYPDIPLSVLAFHLLSPKQTSIALLKTPLSVLLYKHKHIKRTSSLCLLEYNPLKIPFAVINRKFPEA
ncbi:hypothetical protein GOBAR_DD36071 [Gossypium barbadense]|nr:hypothetical protein GOBAR_DD36071 [Gossypium barbadense]